MIHDSKAEELEAKGLYRRAAARWAEVMQLVNTDKEPLTGGKASRGMYP